MELGKIKEKIKEVVNNCGFRLESVKLKTEGEERLLEVVIDNFATSISLDDIVKVSEALNPLLEEDSSLGDNYTLDVTSSGAEKVIPLDEIHHYVSLYISVHLLTPIKDSEILKGYLLENNEDNLLLEVNNKGRISKVNVSKTNIKQINRAIKF